VVLLEREGEHAGQEGAAGAEGARAGVGEDCDHRRLVTHGEGHELGALGCEGIGGVEACDLAECGCAAWEVGRAEPQRVGFDVEALAGGERGPGDQREGLPGGREVRGERGRGEVREVMWWDGDTYMYLEYKSTFLRARWKHFIAEAKSSVAM
jgi:hypothetical protein